LTPAARSTWPVPPRLYERCGLKVEAVEPLCAVARPCTELWIWVRKFLHIFLPSLVEKNYLTQADLDAHSLEWDELEQRRDAFFFAPPLLGVVGVKP